MTIGYTPSHFGFPGEQWFWYRHETEKRPIYAMSLLESLQARHWPEHTLQHVIDTQVELDMSQWIVAPFSIAESLEFKQYTDKLWWWWPINKTQGKPCELQGHWGKKLLSVCQTNPVILLYKRLDWFETC